MPKHHRDHQNYQQETVILLRDCHTYSLSPTALWIPASPIHYPRSYVCPYCHHYHFHYTLTTLASNYDAYIWMEAIATLLQHTLPVEVSYEPPEARIVVDWRPVLHAILADTPKQETQQHPGGPQAPASSGGLSGRA